MSKKKALSTMSLKDFHGGSIPSDLSLPSAPGVLVRSDSDRNMSANWGNNSGRSDLRPRPKSSSAARNLDEKASFLSHPAPMGQNFDEEERKPLNGGLAPRQTVSDGSVHTSSPIQQDMKPVNVSSVRVLDKSVSSPSLVTSSSLRVGGGNHNVVNSQTPTTSNCQLINSQPNAWGVRKEVIAVEQTAKPSFLSGPDALSKISQASALEKVSSGMWQSKKPTQLLPHILYSRGKNVSDGVDVVSKRANYDTLQGSQVKRGQVLEDGTKVGGREPSLLFQAPPPEISERPKSGLFLRSGPLGTSENERRQPVGPGKVESGNELNRNMDSLKQGATVAEGGSQMVERPKLNLKPRSQPLDQSHGRLKSDRDSLFGGARPRELVLKERGIDEIAVGNPDLGDALSRVNISKNEATSERLVPSTQHTQHTAYEKRNGKNLERREQQTGWGKDDNQGRNKWIENRWSSKDAEKQQQVRRPEPDTWRKPIEEEKLVPNDASGKIVLPVDLARAFSKSVSHPTQEQSSTQRGLPGHNNQMPFSRLTDTRQLSSSPSARHQINGY